MVGRLGKAIRSINEKRLDGTLNEKDNMKKAISYAKACILAKQQQQLVTYSLDSGLTFRIPCGVSDLESVWRIRKEYLTFYVEPFARTTAD